MRFNDLHSALTVIEQAIAIAENGELWYYPALLAHRLRLLKLLDSNSMEVQSARLKFEEVSNTSPAVGLISLIESSV